MTNAELIAEIQQLKKEKNAIILAHFYQIPEIQDIADYIGDSLGLSQKAKDNDADVIVFCGVHFMAETAKILSPQKRVLIPDPEAGCSLADGCPAPDFKKFVESHPGHKVISYINCSADIKTLSDVICTSSNAVGIVNSFAADQPLIFAPDKNLGAYINSVTGREMVLWNGSCEVHDILSVERVFALKLQYPEAKIIAHPECRGPILEVSDFVGSTTALLEFTKKDSAMAYIVATETGIIHQMELASPNKQFYIVPSDANCNCNDCPYMKLNTLEKLAYTLRHDFFEIQLPDETIKNAVAPIERMLEISKQMGL